jgi:Flp pilus assembly protein TadG
MAKSLRSNERGTSMVSAAIGFLVVMSFLLIGVHVLLVLHTRTMVRAAAFDAARVVARSNSANESFGDARITAMIGELNPQKSWSNANGFVSVTIEVKSPGMAPFGLMENLKKVSVTARVRREQWQP